MNKPMTVSQLKRFCDEQIKKGNGNCSIMLSNDDEGNGFHYCWYEFSEMDDTSEYIKEFIDEEIAPINKTILLG